MMSENADSVRKDKARLVAENEELKKHLQLMKENEELKKVLSSYTQTKINEKDCREKLGIMPFGHPVSTCVEGTAAIFSVPDTATQAGEKRLGLSNVMFRLRENEDKASSPTFEDYFYTSLQLGDPDQRGLQRGSLSQNRDHKQGTPLTTGQEQTRMSEHCLHKGAPLSEAKMSSSLQTQSPDTKIQSFYDNELRMLPGVEERGRVVGEIAFQLDRRILGKVFPGFTRLYGFSVSNIPEKIQQVSYNPLSGTLQQSQRREMLERYDSLMSQLEKFGYNPKVHPAFCEFVVNTYGILKHRPEGQPPVVYSDPITLRKLTRDTVPAKFLQDSLLILNCLCELSRTDGKPLFTF
nr:PREDICTED: speriolin-like protein isoform X2 [Lepisosteus oculatus]